MVLERLRVSNETVEAAGEGQAVLSNHTSGRPTVLGRPETEVAAPDEYKLLAGRG
jgi:hypothetical protein